MANSLQPPSGPTARLDEFMRLHAQHQRRLYLYSVGCGIEGGDRYIGVDIAGALLVTRERVSLVQ
jgi:hypothetical protein